MSHEQFIPALLSLVFSASVTACGNDFSGSDGSTQRDSAGVRIVEVGTSVPGTAFSLGSPARTTFGGSSEDLESTFFGVVGGIVLEDGRVVIANSETFELFQFDAQGSRLRTVGGRGDGPGEFRGIQWMSRLPGDSIVTWDWYHKRIQVFDRDLELARVVPISPSEDTNAPAVEPLGVLADSRILGWGSEFVTTYPREPLLNHLYRLDPNGEFADSVGPFPSARRIWISGEPPPPFHREAAYAVMNGFLYSAISESDEFRRSTIDGRAEEIFRGGLESRPPTEEEVARALEGRPPTGVGDPWVSAELPYWTKFVVDRTGAVWRRPFVDPEAESVRWVIVTPEGGVSTLVTSSSFTPLDIGEDWILAVEKDAFDVESVHVFDLERGG